jgi:hypothetical protein
MDLLEGFWSIDPNVRKFFTDEPLNLNDILPEKGDIRIVLLPLADYNQEYILWRSPDSEINGWEDTPQEIVCSHVVKCELEIIEDLQLDDELIQWASLTKIHRKYQAKIIDVFPFVDFCKSCKNPSKIDMLYCGQIDGSSKMLWFDCREIYKAVLPGNCIWLSGGASEILLGMIIEIREDAMYAIYNQIYWCLDNIVSTVNYKFEGYEKEFFTSVIKNATIVIDE